MVMNLNDENVDERKLNTIKLRILEMETDNIVKKESKAAMIDKIYNSCIFMYFQSFTKSRRQLQKPPPEGQ